MNNDEVIALAKYANQLLDHHERGQRTIPPTHARGAADHCQHRDCERRRQTIKIIDADTRAFLTRSSSSGEYGELRP